MIIATDKKQRAGVHVSTMTGKLAGIQAINTNTLTNEFCSTMRETGAIFGAPFPVFTAASVRPFFFAE